VEVLDNATGAGVLVDRILDLTTTHPGFQVKRIVAGDIDDNMLAFATSKQQEATSSSAWRDVSITKIDQQAIPYDDNSFTHVFANFGIFFCQDESKALSEAHRVLKPGGVVGFTSWKAITWWAEVAEPALAQFLSDAPELPSQGGMFPSPGWSDMEQILTKLHDARFTDARVTEFSFAPRVPAEEFAEALAVLVKVVAKRAWSGETFIKHADQIEGVLLQYLKTNYAEGVWDGEMTAIITLGCKV
jgi:ubiquinone/menaquinone biosynthesis C-methylase UbiE